jgi:tetratricopeptide (TPR) repeat protein
MRRLALILLLVAAPVHAQLSPEEAARTFAEANAEYQAGESFKELDPATAREHYQKAALRYERLIRDGGLDNGRLYFNWANSLLGEGDYGRAILNYRRALLFLPGDALIEHNLTLARRQRSANLGVSGPPDRPSGLTWTATAKYQGMAFVAVWALAWGLLSIRLFRANKVQRSTLAAAFGAAGVLFLLTAASASQFGEKHGVLTAKQSVPRQGDGVGYQPALAEPLQAGAEFLIIDSAGDWSRVELTTGETVWLPQQDFEVVEEGRHHLKVRALGGSPGS